MARKASVNYWPSRGGYGCWWGGEQKILAKGPDDAPDGPTYRQAVREFSDLVSRGRLAQAGDNNTLRVVTSAFLDFAKATDNKGRTRRKASTLRQYDMHLPPFLDHKTTQSGEVLGDIPICKLRLYHLENYLAYRRTCGTNFITSARRMRGWSEATCRQSIANIRAVIQFGIKRGYLATDPFAMIDVPPMPTRGADCVFKPGEREQLLAAAKGGLRDILVFLDHTGCRPGEAAVVTAAHFRPDPARFVLESSGREHKTAGMGERPNREIYLQGDVLALVQRLMAERPTGRLFRPRRIGQRKVNDSWTVSNMGGTFKRLRDRLLPGRDVVLYSYRHTFATQWILQGGHVDVLASLLGTSAEMIRRHYAHLFTDRSTLGAALQDFLQNRTS